MPRIRTRRRLLAASAVTALALAPVALIATPASAVTFTVTTEAELVQAIDDSNASAAVDDVIDITADIVLTAALPQITDEVEISGNSHSIAANSFMVFLANGTTLNVHDVTIDNPQGGVGGLSATITVDNVIVTDATGSGFGGVETSWAITDSQVSGSTGGANFVSTGAALNTTISVTNSTFSDGTFSGVSIQQGGAGTVTLTDVEAVDNGVYGYDIELDDTAVATLTRAHATGSGDFGVSIIANDSARADLAESDGDNSIGGGRLIANQNATIISTSSGPTGNSGSGWYAQSSSPSATLRLDFVLATLNTIGVYLEPLNGGTITLNDSLIQGGGRGVSVVGDTGGGSVAINRTDIVAADDYGLVVTAANTSISFTDGSITDVDGSGQGAAVHAELDDASLLIERSTIADNTATDFGAGLYVDAGSDSAVTLLDSTLDNNEAPGAPEIIAEVGTFTIAHTTIHHHTALASAFLIGADVLTVTHSILEGGADSGFGDAGTVTVDYSLVQIPGGDLVGAVAAGTGNITGVSAQLGPLADNGGYTRTLLPAPGSPVLDAGSPTFVAPPSVDQRGLARVQHGRIDIGAVEAVAVLPSTGRDLSFFAVLGGAALLLGAGAVVVARRRGVGAAS